MERSTVRLRTNAAAVANGAQALSIFITAQALSQRYSSDLENLPWFRAVIVRFRVASAGLPGAWRQCFLRYSGGGYCMFLKSRGWRI